MPREEGHALSDLGSRAEYALLAATDLAVNYKPGSPVKVQDIARRTGAPEKYLGQILLRLKKQALVRSAQGPSGGYCLMRQPELISAAEVMEAVSAGADGRRRRRPAAGAYGQALDWLKADMEEARRGLLSRVTLADLARRAQIPQ